MPKYEKRDNKVPLSQILDAYQVQYPKMDLGLVEETHDGLWVRTIVLSDDDVVPQYGLTVQEIRTLRANRKIDAIKMVRSRTGMYLAVAKALVDAFVIQDFDCQEAGMLPCAHNE